MPLVDLEKRKAYRRAHYAANRERIIADVKEYASAHREEKRAYNSRYFLANREKLLVAMKEYNCVNREKGASNKREYRAQNLEKVRCQQAASREKHPGTRTAYNATHRADRLSYIKQRRLTDPNFHVLDNLRPRIWGALRGVSKSARTVELLGCTIPELRSHLESQFRPGMTWENYGPVWHIDHRRPCASFDLLDPAQQRECFNYKNLQPLFAEENLKKGAK